ncbi:MAG: hypothetical protein JNM51_16110 [Bacteroidia bacterium]|nr:hypothetical protein [Bacteroidia bacterium]
MKTTLFTSMVILMLSVTILTAQETGTPEKYGKTLNIGAGIGYFGYVGRAFPAGSINFEFDVFKNFTLAPFIGTFSYQRNYYWGDKNTPNRYYYYRTVVVPVGVKGTYYFDQLFHANSKWDFYAAGSLGFAFRNSVWENGYYGDRRVMQTTSPLYLDAHIGAEYHITQKAGLFLDLSTGISTFGLALHF